MDEWYCIDNDYSHSVLDKRGQITTRRGVFNDRGDESTIRSRANSLISIGIVQQRLGPWVIAQKPGSEELEEAYHWASLLDGVERVIKEDPEKKNGVFWRSVSKPLKHGKKYDYRTPEDARKFMKFLGNEVNGEVLENGVGKVQGHRRCRSCFRESERGAHVDVGGVGAGGLRREKIHDSELALPEVLGRP